MIAAGTVYLVGAGPGDPELITVRGLRCLRRADVLVYDRLVHADLIHEAPATAERIFVGKAAGLHVVAQAEIQTLLIDRAQRGHTVVRLKGGDPFVFGRGGEEAAALVRAGIPWEVVPAVSSAVGVPARAGIPVTHRGLAGSFAVVTAHHAEPPSSIHPSSARRIGPEVPGTSETLSREVPGTSETLSREVPGTSDALSPEVPGTLSPEVPGTPETSTPETSTPETSTPETNWAALARIDTLVVLMGVAALPRVVAALRQHGRSAETPVAIIERGSLPDERVTTGTLATIAAQARRARVRSPATIVVGAVVNLRVILAGPTASTLRPPSTFDWRTAPTAPPAQHDVPTTPPIDATSHEEPAPHA